MTAVGINGAAFESQISSFVSVSVSQVSIAKTGDGQSFSSVLNKSFAKVQNGIRQINTAESVKTEGAAKTGNTTQTGNTAETETDKEQPKSLPEETKADQTVKTNDSKDETVDGKEAGKKIGKSEGAKSEEVGAADEKVGVIATPVEIDPTMDPEDVIKALEILNTLMQGIADILNTTVNELQGCYDRLEMEPATMFTVTNIQMTVITFEGLSDPSDLLVNSDALGLFNEIRDFVASVFEESGMKFTDFEDIITSDMFKQFIGPVDLKDAAGILEQFTFDENGKPVIDENMFINEQEMTPVDTEAAPQAVDAPAKDIKFEVNVTEDRPVKVSHKAAVVEQNEEIPDLETAVKVEEAPNALASDNESRESGQGFDNRSRTQTGSVKPGQPGRIETPAEVFIQGLEQTVQSLELETPIADGVTVRDIVYQVVDAIRVNISSESTSLEMNLNPENLGRVNLNIESKGGVMTAQITTENDAARAAIESQLQILKDNFEAQGVRVEAIEVTVSSFSFADSKNADAQAQEHPEDNLRVARSRSRNIQDADTEEEEEVNAEARLAREVMEQNGSTVNFVA